MNPWPVEGFELDEVHLPRPGPRRPRRRPEIRPRRHPQRARAGQRPRDRRPRRRRLDRPRLPRRARGRASTATSPRSPRSSAPERDDLDARTTSPRVDEDPVRCLDPEASAAMVEEINRLRKANESLGGSFEVRAFGLVPGLGSHISWEDRLDGRLAGAVASIQSVKGVAIGEAWDVAGRPGSEAHDEIFWSEERGYYRETNHAGGLEGGMTNGQPLSVRAAIKPISTLTKPLRSVDTETKEPAQALRERTDSTVVPAAAVVAEAMVCLTLARCYREKFGGDHIDDVLAARRRLQAAHRLPAGERGEPKPAIVFIGFMGAGKTHGAGRRPRRRAGDDRDRRADGSASSACRSPRPSSATARRPSARARPRSSARCWRAPTAARSRSAAAASSPSGSAPRSTATSSSGCRSTPSEAWRRIAHSDRPLATSAEDVERLLAERAAALRGAGRRGGPDRRPRRSSAARCRRSAALAELPGRDEAALGDQRLRRVPGLRRPRACSSAGWWPLAGRRFCVTDTRRRRRSTPTALEPLAGRVEVEPGEGGEDDGRGRAGAARAGPRRDDPRGPRRRPRRRRRRRPRRLLRPPLPARRAGRPGADHAGRPGRLRLRRQDRRRPARGQELRRRLPPAGGGDRRHRDARDACRRRSWPPASSRR